MTIIFFIVTGAIFTGIRAGPAIVTVSCFAMCSGLSIGAITLADWLTIGPMHSLATKSSMSEVPISACVVGATVFFLRLRIFRATANEVITATSTFDVVLAFNADVVSCLHARFSLHNLFYLDRFRVIRCDTLFFFIFARICVFIIAGIFVLTGARTVYVFCCEDFLLKERRSLKKKKRKKGTEDKK